MTFFLAVSVSLVLVISSPSPFFFHFCMVVFCVVPLHFLSSASSFLWYLWLCARSWKPLCAFLCLPAPCPAPYPCPLPLALLLLPPKETFQCVLFTIPLFTVIFLDCVILSVLRKALGHKAEMAFSSSPFPSLRKGLPKACSGRSYWTAPLQWQWAWLPKQTKQTRGKDTPPLLPPGTGIILGKLFAIFLKTKQNQLPFSLWCYISPCSGLTHDWVSHPQVREYQCIVENTNF